MDGLINAILKLSREGRRELRAESINLVSLFENAAPSVAYITTETVQRNVFGEEVGEHMRFADEASASAKLVIDAYIERAGLDAPPRPSSIDRRSGLGACRGDFVIITTVYVHAIALGRTDVSSVGATVSAEIYVAEAADFDAVQHLKVEVNLACAGGTKRALTELSKCSWCCCKGCQKNDRAKFQFHVFLRMYRCKSESRLC